MKKLFFKILWVIDVLAIIIYLIFAHLLTKVDYESGVMTDGFGRLIVEPPLFFRLFSQLGEWVGLKWFIIDTIGFWGAIFIARLLFDAITDIK